MTDYTIQLPIAVLWGDMDALGHVNNARYFTWFEAARMCLFEQIGMNTRAAGEIGPILATATCDFLKPVYFPAQLISAVTVSRVGRSSFTLQHLITLKDGPPVATGSGVIVMVNYAAEHSVPLSPAIRAALEALVKASS